jgi:phosphatidylserine/phosphatidylglycerophosphate/cardiolipin synthase-like enzyme
LAIDDRWAGNARNPEEWRDTMVRLDGPVVLQMQRLFLEDWLYSNGEYLDGFGQFPVARQAGDIKAQAVGNSRTGQLSLDYSLNLISPCHKPGIPHPPDPATSLPSAAFAPG